ncbi:hypothetical protein GJ744_010951 [Endocarpon pusillum]|uniref:Uncharacterized protein n=1 Tax=Endocarpon pusillum TaxID=364733 RepID=A0A8H7ADJ0_9EURO|nr:hypothetical protein GJ744_010951 [Endocarpon pusillum]
MGARLVNWARHKRLAGPVVCWLFPADLGTHPVQRDAELQVGLNADILDQTRDALRDAVQEGLRAWATAADIGGRAKNYGNRLHEAELKLNNPDTDPWAATERDVTLPFLLKQVFRIHYSECTEPERVKASMELLRQVLADATDLRDKDQARKLRDALLGTMLAIEEGRQDREATYYETRVDPGEYVPEIRGLNEPIWEQLFGEMTTEGASKRVAWQVSELDAPIEIDE